MPHEASLITTLTAALAAAWLLGILAKRLGLSPIIGYVLAGVLVGPHTPGFVGDLKLAAELAEIGVVLLMFGVGLHFHLKDLLAVQSIALPGALAKSVLATALGVTAALAFGWPLAAGLVLGLALSVASTVVLMRSLEDHQLLTTTHGHVAVGWLIAEDILTVIVLVAIPPLAGELAGGAGPSAGAGPLLRSLAIALAKLAVLVLLVIVAGSRVVPWVLQQAARLRSRELFTLTVLALAMTVATLSAFFFGASLALGAFLAGMAVGQSPLSQQAAADALPLRDAFAVLFFVSVGMLFDPTLVLRQAGLLLAALGIVLVAKPLIAMAVVALLGYSVRTALTVSLGLAQVGEFSFILAQLAHRNGLLPADGHGLLVACALVSISVNPMLIGALDPIEGWLRRRPWLWLALNARAESRRLAVNAGTVRGIEQLTGPLAVIVGYGPVGRTVDRLIRQAGIETVVVDQNVDTVTTLAREGRLAVYGDATQASILRQAGVGRATHLIVTLPHSVNRGPLIVAARRLNPDLRVVVRARYLRELRELQQAGAGAACFEEAEAAVALGRAVLQDLGADASLIERESQAIRAGLPTSL